MKAKLRSWYRWLFRHCMDCGAILDKSYARGDVCQRCFDEYNGMTMDELLK